MMMKTVPRRLAGETPRVGPRSEYDTPVNTHTAGHHTHTHTHTNTHNTHTQHTRSQANGPKRSCLAAQVSGRAPQACSRTQRNTAWRGTE